MSEDTPASLPLVQPFRRLARLASRRSDGTADGTAVEAATVAGPQWLTPTSLQWQYAPRDGFDWSQLMPRGDC